MLSWSISSRTFPLRYTWKISRNASDAKTNLFVEINGERCKGMGEAAPNIRYNEIPDNLLADFTRIQSDLPAKQIALPEFVSLLDDLRLSNALRFAVESAYIHWLCAKGNMTVYEFFGLQKPVAVPTAFSLPIMPVNELIPFIEKQHIRRFKCIKIKVNREEAIEVVHYVATHLEQPLLVDANESFRNPDEVLLFLEKIDTRRLIMLEQPMPSVYHDEYIYLKRKISLPLFADESITDNVDIKELEKGFHGINMKLMKAGGYLKGIQQLKAAREAGLATMIGCMVETTLGISSALHLSSLADYIDLDGFLILQGEPFELVQEKVGFLNLA
jgi:L-alanine-DL-glutamate epimerase-like enolase superfamily enzyme